MDELRDYRFYQKDMVHPNAIAIEYIWEKFKTSHISKESFGAMNEIESIQKGLRHQLFDLDSEERKKFKKSLQTKIKSIQERYPFTKFQ